ncbi:MAG TPA: nucleotidyltransferase domain-containing protein [Methanothrix sp.]|nr:nucleotidyltransferase domain-containing protein [Methanothrix sp.]HPJ84955.1 nucleotidyltransferase domain-containing protein [Methanothrix sp.]
MQAVRDTVIEILRENGVKRAAFFGSIVSGEMDEESDIDILIEFEGRRSLLDLAHVSRFCSCTSPQVAREQASSL